MSLVVNVQNVKVNHVNNNASITIGPALLNSHSAQTKLFGNNIVIGDNSIGKGQFTNYVDDRDLMDQGIVGNSDRVYQGGMF
jgi:hypothetical protein